MLKGNGKISSHQEYEHEMHTGICLLMIPDFMISFISIVISFQDERIADLLFGFNQVYLDSNQRIIGKR